MVYGALPKQNWSIDPNVHCSVFRKSIYKGLLKKNVWTSATRVKVVDLLERGEKKGFLGTLLVGI